MRNRATSPLRRLLVLTVSLLSLAAACGDDGADVRDVGGSGTGSGSGSASGSATGSASGSASGSATGSASGTEEAECSPVGEDLEGDAAETVEITLTEYAFEPGDVEVGAGVVTFTATNDGTENHELAFLPGGGDVPLTDDGVPDEDALADAGAFELEAFGPEQSCSATYDLEPGVYTLFCIVEAPDGETHYDKGMEGELTVE